MKGILALRDQPLIEKLMIIHSARQWTCDWLLLKYFRRFATIPSGDLAVRKAFTWLLGKKEIMMVEELKKAEKKYAPLGGLLAQRVLLTYQEAQARG